MKKILILVLMLMSTFLIVSCQSHVEAERPNNDIYYQIFVRSFADSNGDGIGDLNGITENLTYIDDFGATAIWLTPIHPSKSYHGYDVEDYYDIHPDFGTLEDFKNLVSEAEKLGIKIMIDLVINHTSDTHPWYLSSVKNEVPYNDYYINDFESFPGGMKDLDLGNPLVVEEIKNILDFYLDMGVLGFRLDAAKHFFAKPGISDATNKNIIFVGELNRYLKEKNEKSYLISEVLDTNYQVVDDYYLTSDGMFNFYVREMILSKIGRSETKYNLVSNLNRMYESFDSFSQTYIDAPFISNHDLDRVASSTGFLHNPDILKLATRFLLTLPGNPYIYYGDELGMKGSRYEGENIEGYGLVYDEYRRQPFIWGDDRQTTWLPSDGSNNLTNSFLIQKEDENSLYQVYKEMNKIRKENDALMYGRDFKPYKNNGYNIQGFVRTYDDGKDRQAVLVLHNLSDKEQIVIDEYIKILYGNTTIEPYGTVIVEINFNDIGAYI